MVDKKKCVVIYVLQERKKAKFVKEKEREQIKQIIPVVQDEDQSG